MTWDPTSNVLGYLSKYLFFKNSIEVIIQYKIQCNHECVNELICNKTSPCNYNILVAV